MCTHHLNNVARIWRTELVSANHGHLFKTMMTRTKRGWPRSVTMTSLGRLSSLMLLLLNLRMLQEQGDAVRLLGTLQAPMLLATRVRVRVGGSDNDFWANTMLAT